MCVTSSDGSTSGSSSICPAGYTVATQQAYVISSDSQAYFDSLTQPFDIAAAGDLWAGIFISVISLYLVAKGAGMVANFVKKV